MLRRIAKLLMKAVNHMAAGGFENQFVVFRISWERDGDGKAGSITICSLQAAKRTAAGLTRNHKYHGVQLHSIQVTVEGVKTKEEVLAEIEITEEKR